MKSGQQTLWQPFSIICAIILATSNLGNAQVTAVCKNTTIQLDQNGYSSLSISDVDNGSNADVGIASIYLNQTNFNRNHLGPALVILAITDNLGNVASCTATVTIEDTLLKEELVCQDLPDIVKSSEIEHTIELDNASDIEDDCSDATDIGLK